MSDCHEMTEVERLRHENECLNATIAQREHPCSPHCYEYLNELRLRDRIEALTAEVERLRAAVPYIIEETRKVVAEEYEAAMKAMADDMTAKFRALCDMIERYEQPPPDRKLLCAREAMAGCLVPMSDESAESAIIRAIELWIEGYGE